MKKIFLSLLIAFGSLACQAEEISNIECSGSWVYIYNSAGKKYKTLSTSSVGTVLGFSSSFFVTQNGSWIYLYNADGKKYNTLSVNTVGQVIGVAGDTFTSRNGNWIYTWSKEGKKINTRSAH